MPLALTSKSKMADSDSLKPSVLSGILSDLSMNLYFLLSYTSIYINFTYV
jgi:hypothetical protein